MKKPTVNYEQWGMAAAIPGLQIAIDRLQEMLDEMREMLNGNALPKKAGRPPGKSSNSYWAKMTAEERSAEVKRRVALGRRKSAPPKPEEAVAQKSAAQNGAAQRAYWASMSPQQRKAEMKRRARVSEKNGAPMIGAKSFPAEGKTVQ